MKQIIQNQKNGEITIQDLPAPALRKGWIIVHNVASLISTGTERMSVTTAQASLLGKARLRPDLVSQVYRSAKREGLMATYRKVQSRLQSYKALGYSSSGVVVQSGVPEFKPGDRVACAGYAYHAELIAVPKNLATKLPEGVSFEEGSFATIGAIALQGVRQADVRIGERIAVIGLGLLGLMTVQLLRASGCRVIGLDIMDANFKLAEKLGCDACTLSDGSAPRIIRAFTEGQGTDAVIITAGTSSNAPLEMSLDFARKKSRIVVVGAVRLDIPRSPFYEKELDVRISCSYGPGRYDPSYEEQGHDYPIGYVRWTENRNMGAVLDLLAEKKIHTDALVSHRFKLDEALDAYDIIVGKQKEKFLAILIDYAWQPRTVANSRIENSRKILTRPGRHTIGFIGAGNFAQSYLIPHLQREGIRLKGVCTATPVSSKTTLDKFGFEYATTDPNQIFEDSEINSVFVTTRHDTHAEYVVAALQHGKHVFVEKPLAISLVQLENIRKAYSTVDKLCLMVGFNRRFSRPFEDMKNFFGKTLEPFLITYRVNAGVLSAAHWLQDENQGGRIIGEGCHFVDCMQFVTAAAPVAVDAIALGTRQQRPEIADNAEMVIRFSDGSIGALIYVTNGDSSVPKEYCEISSGGRSVIMDDFRRVEFYKDGTRRHKSYNGKKGHEEEIKHFLNVVRGNEEVHLSFDSEVTTSLAMIKAVESLRKGKMLEI